MNKRILVGIWKATEPLWIWVCLPLWIGSIILGLDGRTPEWGPVLLFLATVTVGVTVADFANTYVDRDADRVYGPTNPLVTGELDARTAKTAFIVQNILGIILLVALLSVTLNYWLIVALVLGWLAGLTYSLPPFKFKETILGPFIWSLGIALLPLTAWLSVASLNSFMIAFAIFFYMYSFGTGITLKFRKTLVALNSGVIQIDRDSSMYDLSIVGFKLKVKTAMTLEAMTTLGAFVLVPIFWHLEIFDSPLSIGLLSLPLVLAILAVVMRLKGPVKNSMKCSWLMRIGRIFIALTLFGVALSTIINWGFAILACIGFFLGFVLLLRAVHPWGAKALGQGSGVETSGG